MGVWTEHTQHNFALAPAMRCMMTSSIFYYGHALFCLPLKNSFLLSKPERGEVNANLTFGALSSQNLVQQISPLLSDGIILVELCALLLWLTGNWKLYSRKPDYLIFPIWIEQYLKQYCTFFPIIKVFSTVLMNSTTYWTLLCWWI